MKKGVTIWIAGLSASGKSTLARKLVEHLNASGKKTQLIDGDVIRNELGGLFGYSKEDRIRVANIYRTMAILLNENGVNAVVAAITPYEEMRRKNRERIKNYIEISLECPIEECIKRDPKGLYQKALAGLEKFVIGIDDVYETPISSDLVVNTHQEDIQTSFWKILNFIGKVGI